MHSSHRVVFRSAVLVSAIALSFFVINAQAQTYDFRVVHRFSGAPYDGDSPDNTVQFDAAGNLYGTTRNGGAYDSGTIFKIAKDGVETIVHSFDGAAGGDEPSGVAIDPATGDLYGPTMRGGNLSACPDISHSGCGVLYRLAANGDFSVLHSFDVDEESSFPDSRLLLDQQGNLYGTTVQLGTTQTASVFKYDANGTFTVLRRFPEQDGYPVGGVMRDGSGNLYGVTNLGGINLNGAIYKLTPDGTYTTLHSFTGLADGGNSAGGLVGDEAGNLYGTTSSGGTGNWGTVFKLASDGSFTTLYSFTRGADGGGPNGDLLLIGGNLYGTTKYVGSDNPICNAFYVDAMCGVVFKLAQDGTQTVLHTFKPYQGITPVGGLVLRHRRLFGMTATTVRSGSGLVSGGAVYSIGVTNP